VIQLIATDKKNSKKQEGIAVQALGFTVVENQTCETEGSHLESLDGSNSAAFGSTPQIRKTCPAAQ